MSDLGSLQICYSVWLSCPVGLLSVGRGAVSNSFTGFWGPTPHTGLPSPVLIHGEVLLQLNKCACFADSNETSALS